MRYKLRRLEASLGARVHGLPDEFTPFARHSPSFSSAHLSALKAITTIFAHSAHAAQGSLLLVAAKARTLSERAKIEVVAFSALRDALMKLRERQAESINISE